MTPETQQPGAAPLEPTKETVSEMSLGAALRRAIDDLFTYRAIGEKVQAIPPNDVLDALVETWKQGLTNRLHGEAQTTVDNVAAILDLLQSDEALSTLDPTEWQQVERWYAPFQVATVCREDLHHVLSEGDIAQLSDEDMADLATQMGDALRQTAVYWQSLDVTARSVLTEKQRQPAQPLEPHPPTPQAPDPAS